MAYVRSARAGDRDARFRRREADLDRDDRRQLDEPHALHGRCLRDQRLAVLLRVDRGQLPDYPRGPLHARFLERVARHLHVRDRTARRHRVDRSRVRTADADRLQVDPALRLLTTATALLTHPDCVRHEMGAGHPESPQRLRAILEALEASGLSTALTAHEAPEATRAQLAR